MEHYLDNSATTAVSERAARRAYEVMTENYGNPSSLHGRGMLAERELEVSRKTVASALSASAEEIYFTGGGTESNNLALFGAAYAKRRVCNRIVTTAIEHDSVLESAEQLKREGFDVVFVKPAPDGTVSARDVLAEIDGRTALVSVMLVNNETGAVLPTEEIFEGARRISGGIICHTDAVQAFGKLRINARRLKADLISVSAHKVHAPKGCGALYVRKGVRILPRMFGGEQEKKLRPGTEALPLISAFAAACSEFDIENNYKKILELNAYAKKRLSEIGGVLFNSPEKALPYVLNISAGGVRSETMLHFLEEREIYVSSGSACAKGRPSRVLSAMGLSRGRADSALRISFSKYNGREDVDALCAELRRGLDVLVQKQRN